MLEPYISQLKERQVLNKIGYYDLQKFLKSKVPHYTVVVIQSTELTAVDTGSCLKIAM